MSIPEELSEMEVTISYLLELWTEGNLLGEKAPRIIEGAESSSGYVPKVPIPIFIVSERENIVFHNELFAALFACGEDELVGQPYLELFPENSGDRKRAAALLESSKGGGIVLREAVRGRTAEGEEFPFFLSILPCADESGNVVEHRCVALPESQSVSELRDQSASDQPRAEALFRQNLGYFRQRDGVSQEKLAQICGYDRTYIGKLERGDSSPSLHTVDILAEAFDVPVVEFFRTREKGG